MKRTSLLKKESSKVISMRNTHYPVLFKFMESLAKTFGEKKRAKKDSGIKTREKPAMEKSVVHARKRKEFL